MKQLFINGEQVIMDSDQYFPFTYKLSDLEEINLINFPSTKSIMIPKTIRNDDIFGHIAEITRLTYGYEDSKVGVSFNQFKKGQYELLDNNVVISKGIIRIVNITDDEYEIELYDQAIELLEILEDKNLDQLTIINPQTGLPLSERVNYATVADMIIKDYGILPIFGDYDTPYEGSKMFIRKKSGPSVSELEVELPVSMTPLKLRTFSAADIPYVIKLNNIFNMIEAEGDVIFSQSVRDLTTHTRMLLSKPINSLITSETKGKLHTFNRPTLGEASNGNITITDLMYLQNADSSNILFFNGNYLIKNKFKFVFETNSTQSGSIWTNYKGINYDDNTAYGTVIGELSITSQMIMQLDAGNSFFFPNINTKIVMRKDINTSYTKVGGKGLLTIEGTFILTSNFYPKTKIGNSVKVSSTFTNTPSANSKTLLFNLKTGLKVNTTIEPTLVLKPLEFIEYDLLTSNKLMPSMTIKDFVVDIAKTYNLNISIKNNKLFIDIKRYYLTDEVLVIDNKADMDVNKVNFSKLKIKSGYPDSDLIEEYNKTYNEWCSQIINTGYTIKKEEKEIELPYSTPLAIVDYDYFAYDQFDGYLNGGYSKVTTGNIKGLSGLVLGYLKFNNDEIYISDAQIVNGERLFSNKRLYYTPSAVDDPIMWKFNRDSAISINVPDVAMVNTYPTFMPYRFVDDYVTESMEVNKPHYTFANMADEEYPVSATLYHRFHKNMLEDKYDANTHILTAQILLDGEVDTGKVYNYKNSFYIISELVEYDPTEPGLYEVKLMRVNNPLAYITPPLPTI